MLRDYFQDHSNVLFRGIQNDKLNSLQQKFRRLYVTRTTFIRSTGTKGRSSIFAIQIFLVRTLNLLTISIKRGINFSPLFVGKRAH